MDISLTIHFFVFLIWVWIFDLIVNNKNNYTKKEYIFWYTNGMIWINYELSMTLYRGYHVLF